MIGPRLWESAIVGDMTEKVGSGVVLFSQLFLESVGRGGASRGGKHKWVEEKPIESIWQTRIFAIKKQDE